MSIHQVSLKIAQQMVDDEDEREKPSAFQRALPWLAGAAGIAGAGYLGYQAMKPTSEGPGFMGTLGDIGRKVVGYPAAAVAGAGDSVGGTLGAAGLGALATGAGRVARDNYLEKLQAPDKLPLKTLADSMSNARVKTVEAPLGRLATWAGLGDTSKKEMLADRDTALSKLPTASDPNTGAPKGVQGPEWGRKTEEAIKGMPWRNPNAPVTVQHAIDWAKHEGPEGQDMARTLRSAHENYGINALKNRPDVRYVARPLGAAGAGALGGAGLHLLSSWIRDKALENQ